MSKSIDDLKAAVIALQSQDALVINSVAALTKNVFDLTQALSAAGSDDPDIEAAAKAIQDEVAKLTVMVTPPVI